MSEYLEERDERGFTLIELLVAIVVVGILAAVAIVGIGALTTSGGKSACRATKDAAVAASTSYYADNNGAWPADFAALTPGPPEYLKLQNDVHVDATATYLDSPPLASTHANANWTIQMTFPNGAGTEPVFVGTGTAGCG
jgi:prepilin-type N-terminal cleavage/methylation domain-containing protein